MLNSALHGSLSVVANHSVRLLRSYEYARRASDCTDVDDALSARQLPNGQIEVGVHIADVSYFVKKVKWSPCCVMMCSASAQYGACCSVNNSSQLISLALALFTITYCNECEQDVKW